MNQVKILKGKWNPDSHISNVIKKTPYGVFVGSVVCHEDDMDIENAWDGCRFAEIKCDLQALRQELKVKKREYAGAEKMFKTLYFNGTYNSPEVKDKIEKYGKKELYRLKKEIKEIEGYIHQGYCHFEEITDKQLNERRRFRKRYEVVSQREDTFAEN